MQDGAIHYKLYLLKLTMTADNFVFRIIRSILMFICSYQSLMNVFLYNTIKWPYEPKHSPSYYETLNKVVSLQLVSLEYCYLVNKI